MDEVLERLKDGIRRFRRDVYPDQAEQYLRVMSEPQNPHALIITCADSRIHPDALTQAAPGDIFVTRNIGNMVPAYGEMLGGVSAVLEFAVSAMKVEHIVVCGHSDCGAMKGLLEPATVASMPTVQAWLRNAAAALEVAKAIQEAELAAGGKPDLLKIVTEQNVLLQMQHVRTHPAVAGALAKGALSVSGWVYDIAHGEVRICEGETNAFELLV